MIWLLIDIDGALSPTQPETPYTPVSTPAGTANIPIMTQKFLRSLPTGVTPLWYSCWEEHALKISEHLELPIQGYVPLPDGMCDEPRHVKLEGLRDWWRAINDRDMVIIVDDDLLQSDVSSAVVIHCDPTEGMNTEIIAEVLRRYC